MEKTLIQYDTQLAICRRLFVDKTTDYGTSWRVMKPTSLTDQLYIKVLRIRTISDSEVTKVDEPIDDAFRAIVNYGIMALIQLEQESKSDDWNWTLSQAEQAYDKHASSVKSLMIAKNHDYGEAWREMRISSINDLVLMKLLRIKQIEDNHGETIVSEGLQGNYMDIINYALFCLIKLEEKKQ